MERGCARYILSKALWNDVLPKGGKKEVKTLKNSHAEALRSL